MFSNEERVIYRNNPLGEVICQIRFPEILRIGAEAPVAFQEAIRDEFPRYTKRMESPAPKISGVPGNLSLENRPQTVNHQFLSADGSWRVNLTSQFVSLACNRYTCWEDFALKLDKPLAAFIQIYKPAYFERVGLRYINFISRKALELESIPFRELIAPAYLGLLGEDDVTEAGIGRCGVDAELPIRSGCRIKLHAGPGIIRGRNQQDTEIKFVLDLDLFMPGKVPVNYAAGALHTLHSQTWPIFRGAITETLHNAFDPM